MPHTHNQICSKTNTTHNPAFNSNVKTNLEKMYLQLIKIPFPPANQLHKIINRNTVKFGYSWTQNISQIRKRHNKKFTQIKQHHQLECNCRIKTKCPLNSDCRKEHVIYKCTALTTFQTKKCILALLRVSLKSKDIITTPIHFKTRNIRTVQHSLVMFRK